MTSSRPSSSSYVDIDSMATMRDFGTTDRASGDAQPSLGRIDHYRLLRKLGGGGFGVVYLALDTASGIEVALKTLHPALKYDAEELDRLRSQFALVARLAHPNIATALVLHPAHEIDIPDETVRRELRLAPGDPVMVMRYAPGVTLSRWRLQFPDGIVPPAQTAAIVRQVAEALDYAHGERIVHRDIKPGNVMVETLPSAGAPTDSGVGAGQDGTPSQSIRIRILDFGLAAEIRSSLSRHSAQTGDTSGTRPYMAPEQWAGRKQDGLTDQYALACVAYELLAGSPPFAGVFETGDPAIMLLAVERRPPDPVEGIPQRANSALARALSKTPGERYPSCREFAEALASGLGLRPSGSARSDRPLFSSPRRMPPQAESVLSALGPLARKAEDRLGTWTKEAGTSVGRATILLRKRFVLGARSVFAGIRGAVSRAKTAVREAPPVVAVRRHPWMAFVAAAILAGIVAIVSQGPQPAVPGEHAPMRELFEARRAWIDFRSRTTSPKYLAECNQVIRDLDLRIAESWKSELAHFVEDAEKTQRSLEAAYAEWRAEPPFRSRFETVANALAALKRLSPRTPSLRSAEESSAALEAAARWMQDTSSVRRRVARKEKELAAGMADLATAYGSALDHVALREVKEIQASAARSVNAGDYDFALEQLQRAINLFPQVREASDGLRIRQRIADIRTDALAIAKTADSFVWADKAYAAKRAAIASAADELAHLASGESDARRAESLRDSIRQAVAWMSAHEKDRRELADVEASMLDGSLLLAMSDSGADLHGKRFLEEAKKVCERMEEVRDNGEFAKAAKIGAEVRSLRSKAIAVAYAAQADEARKGGNWEECRSRARKALQWDKDAKAALDLLAAFDARSRDGASAIALAESTRNAALSLWDRDLAPDKAAAAEAEEGDARKRQDEFDFEGAVVKAGKSVSLWNDFSDAAKKRAAELAAEAAAEEQRRKDTAEVVGMQEAIREIARLPDIESSWDDKAYVAHRVALRDATNRLARLSGADALPEARKSFEAAKAAALWMRGHASARKALSLSQLRFSDRVTAIRGNPELASGLAAVCSEAESRKTEADAMADEGRYAEAAKLLDAALERIDERLGPFKAEQSLKLATHAREAMGKGRWVDALAFARHAIRWDGANADAVAVEGELSRLLHPVEGSSWTIPVTDRHDPSKTFPLELRWNAKDKVWRSPPVTQGLWLSLCSPSHRFYPRDDNLHASNVTEADCDALVKALNARPEAVGWTFRRSLSEHGSSVDARNKLDPTAKVTIEGTPAP